jgi:hypothetical protein
MIERHPITLDDPAYGWEYLWSVLHENLGTDANPTDPTTLMILKIIHQISTQAPIPLIRPASGRKSKTLKFSEVEVFAILWTLRRYQKWTIGNEAYMNRKLCANIRKQLDASTKVPKPK